MPNIREEIGKTFRRFGWGDRTVGASLAETVLATDPREGQDYGSYRILRRLGFGGMGHVYLALDTRLGRYVALKFLDPRLTNDPEMLARLQQEARTASSLNHPNILTIYEFAESNGELFIASEYVDGITLRAAIDRKLITPAAAVELASQIASALVAAHSAGITHRDLKPRNIMIRQDGLVKIIDFGLAKVDERAAGFERSPANTGPAFAGTVQYMSPEQARGDQVDSRTDLWSLGVVLYEMLAGQVPFEGATESHIIVSILDQPVPPFEGTAEMPVGVTEIIDRALTKEKNKRYQKAADMLADLQSLSTGRQGSSAFGVRVAPKRSFLGWTATAVCAAVLAALGLWWWFAMNGRDRVLGPDWFKPAPAEQVTFNGHVWMATISPDGKHLAYTSREHGAQTLHVLGLKTKKEFALPAIDDKYIGLSFSPDSQMVYFVVKDRREWGRLYSIAVQGGIPRLLVEDVDGPVTFSPDGNQFAFTRRSETARSAVYKIIVTRANDTGDQKTLAQKTDSFIGLRMAWSPDGKDIAAVVPRAELRNPALPHLYFYPVTGREPREVFSDRRFSDLDDPVWLEGRRLVAFSAVTTSLTAERAHLYQFSPSTRQYRQMFDEWIVPKGLSATADGQTVAVVRKRAPGAVWIVDVSTSNAVRLRLTGDLADPDTAGWLNQRELIVSGSDTQAVGLWRVGLDGKSTRLSTSSDCAEYAPSPASDGSSVAYISNCAGGGIDYNVWRRDLKTGRAERLTSGSNVDLEPNVSPDGKWVVYSSAPAAVATAWKVPLHGGTAQQVAGILAESLAISPDSKYLLCIIREAFDGSRRPAILSLKTGRVVREFPTLRVQNPLRWRPDGEAIAFVDPDRMRIWALPLRSRVARVVATSPDKDPIYDFSWDANGQKLALVTAHDESDAILLRNAKNH